MSSRIAIVSYFSNRGQGVLARGLHKALTTFGHEVAILGRTDLVSGPPRADDEWAFAKKMTPMDEYFVPDSVMKKVASENDYVVFVEEQWGQENLTKIAKAAGAKTVGIPMSEFLTKEFFQNSTYDHIICPTNFCRKRCEELVGDNHHRYKFSTIPWWVEDVFISDPIEEILKDEEVVFFHPAGWGGMHGRRGTEYVYRAFHRAFVRKGLGKFKLIIQGQRKIMYNQDEKETFSFCGAEIEFIWRDLPLADYLDLWRSSHVAVLPSMWEGIGLTFLEAIGFARPIITVDSPPMNSYLEKDITGFCSAFDLKTGIKGIQVGAAVPDLTSLYKAMQSVVNDGVISGMSKRIADKRETLWGLESRRELFSEIFS